MPSGAQSAPNVSTYAQVVARAWRDPAFKGRLLATAADVLRECGIAVPVGMEVCVLEDTDRRTYLVLPRAPQGELGEAELATAAGGLLFGGAGAFGGDPVSSGW